MSTKSSEKVKLWRSMTKEKMVEAMGGKCSVCGYHKSLNSLAFHHIEPEHKDFGFGGMRANPKKWEKIVEELRKCICVCHNCHGEIHDGITTIPKNVVRFNEDFAELKFNKVEPCPVCTNDKPIFLTTCSKNCAAKLSRSIKWNKIDFENKTINEIAIEAGCSELAVQKRKRKMAMAIGVEPIVGG